MVKKLRTGRLMLKFTGSYRKKKSVNEYFDLIIRARSINKNTRKTYVAQTV